ncbi:basic proline-rich protein [Dermacentor silvarum]|uniref:basic proline-rich protein n=1 Tax=Dermacentor silvarum TaxID=543639 RepID=UPI001896F661|nr:basic proline-rich protein [Dermacentor silvarum]
MVREQNLILTYTSNPQIADKLIDELAVPSPVGPVPLFGHLRADTQDSCYGVVTVCSSDTEATLRESLYWPEGEILHVRRLGTSNKVRLAFSGKAKPRYVSYDALVIPVQPYKKTVPACGWCGSVGHRPDSCPGPKPDLCGMCGKAVPLTDGARAPYECTPRCALCAGPHVTAGRCCKERYRTPPPKSPTPPPEGQAGPKKRERRRPRKPRKTGPRASLQRAQPPATKPTPPPHPDAGAIGPSLRGQTPDGPATRKSTTRQVSPASPKPHPPSPEPKPTAKGESLVGHPRPARTPGEWRGRGSLSAPTIHDP